MSPINVKIIRFNFFCYSHDLRKDLWRKKLRNFAWQKMLTVTIFKINQFKQKNLQKF